MLCAACQKEISGPGRYCPECAETVAMPAKPPSSTVSHDDGRFSPGTLLSDRYRIISMAGRGGMGEVYRATDIKLNQPVALKFLPAAVAKKPGLLERFHGEVRIARQVSHPNVCRVYDIGEAEGTAFISMEYVDGEDLGSLLRRIGHLPAAKATEIARKLCAGLAAAHAKGVLHRDLKPGNIMIDGRGQVLIMDFGLAALADSVAGAEVRNGTPAYMAPEQKSGREVTERSDIYSLGLVLSEVFTGQKASADSKLSSLVKDIDPAVEKAIARCLDPDPAKRPQSALGLARMLPGGDPLAEALAAGDTPSPELVANSGSTEGLRVPVAIACLAAVILGIGAVAWTQQRTIFVNQVPMEFAPDILAVKARDIAAGLGYTERPVDRAYGWFRDLGYINYANTQPDAERRLAQLGTNRPPALIFWYREAPRYLVGEEGGAIERNNPSAAAPGNLQMWLDSEGRLLQFQAWPSETPSVEKPATDFSKLLTAAGFDASKLTAAEPAWTPPMAIDTRAAWTGTEGSDPVRIEAASWQGRIVALQRQLPWNVAPPPANNLFSTFFTVFLPLVAAFVAWRNLRLGRGDKRGATRLAGFGLVCSLTSGLLNSHHVPQGAEGFVIFTALRDALYNPVTLWLTYVAFEPFLRRYVPNTLIGWSRLLEGRWRDPLVGGNLLAGTAMGLGMILVLIVVPDTTKDVFLPADASGSIAWLAEMARTGISATLLLTLLWLLFRIPTRRDWLASVLFIGVTVAVVGARGIGILSLGTCLAMVALLLTRFGVLALAAAFVTGYLALFGSAPWTTSVTAWYATPMLLAIAVILAIAIFGFRTTLAGRPLWQDDGENLRQ